MSELSFRFVEGVWNGNTKLVKTFIHPTNTHLKYFYRKNFKLLFISVMFRNNCNRDKTWNRF